jgi:hypothetical protein
VLGPLKFRTIRSISSGAVRGHFINKKVVVK